MIYEIIFSALVVIFTARLCAYAKFCIREKNIAGAIMLFTLGAILVGFAIFGFIDL